MFEVKEIETPLSDREEFALIAFIALRSTMTSEEQIEKLKIRTYCHSKPFKSSDKDAETRKKNTASFFGQKNVTEFIEEHTKFYGNIFKGQKQQESGAGDISANEDLINQLEELKNSTQDPDTKIKCIREQVNIRHKNKEQFKETHRITRLYAPIRCDGCPIYKEAKYKYEIKQQKNGQ